VVLYFLTSIAWVTGALEALILSVLFFIRLYNGTPMYIVNFVRLVHKIMGYVAIIVSMWCLMSGMYSYNSNIKYLMFVHWGGYLVAYAVLEVIH